MPLESLCQGVQLTLEVVEQLCDDLSKKVSELENQLAASSKSSHQSESHPSDMASMLKG